MKVLVTGGAGYLGSVLVGKLLYYGHSVVVLDKLLFNQTSLLQYCENPMFKFVYGDVRDSILLKKLCNDTEAVIPLAAIVGFPACAMDPDLAEQVNHEQILDIIEFTKGRNVKIIYPNTNSGYGVGKDGICTEESPMSPISVYGATKVAAELALRQETDTIILRLATVFGVSPRMRTDLLVNDFVYKALTDKYIVIFEKKFKRNFIHIQDVAYTFCFMLENYDTEKGNVYNVGLSDANLSKEELLEKIQTHIPNFAVSYNDYYEDPDKRDYIVSNVKLEKTGWRAAWSLDRGIDELIMGYQMVVPKMGAEFRNGFPLGYSNKN